MANKFINPTILAMVVEEKLGDKIKLYPLAKKEALNGKAGEVVTVPVIAYIGEAETVGAGVAITPADYTQGSKTCPIQKSAKALKFTQEDINNNFLDLQAEAEKQLTKSIADKIEKDLFGALATAELNATIGALDVDGLADAVVPFGEDLEEDMYLFVSPADLPTLRKDDQFIVNAGHGDGIVKSAGMIFGMHVVVTNNVTKGTAYIVKEDAVGLYLRKAIDVEMDKNILDQTHVIVATCHYAVVLNDVTKAIKVTVGA